MKLRMMVSLAAAALFVGVAAPANAAVVRTYNVQLVATDTVVSSGSFTAVVEEHPGYEFRIASIVGNPAPDNPSGEPHAVSFSGWKKNVGPGFTPRAGTLVGAGLAGVDVLGGNWGVGNVDANGMAEWQTNSNLLTSSNAFSMAAGTHLKTASDTTHLRIALQNSGQWVGYTQVTPEPATIALAAAGMAPLAGLLKRRRRNSEVEETEEIA